MGLELNGPESNTDPGWVMSRLSQNPVRSGEWSAMLEPLVLVAIKQRKVIEKTFLDVFDGPVMKVWLDND